MLDRLKHRVLPDSAGGLVSVGAVLLLGLVLRLWGIRFGLPFIYHFDEHFYVATALKIGTGVINNPPFAPTGFSNILFGQFAAYFLFERALGIVISGQEFEALYRTDPSAFYTLARLASAILGTATIAVVYCLGRFVSGNRTGIVAAVILATSFLHVRDSHYAVPDVAMPLFVVLAVALAASGMQKNKRARIYVASIAAGFAIATKWTATPMVFPIWYAAFSVSGAVPSSRSMKTRLISRTVVWALLLGVLGFIVGSWQIVANPRPYLNEALGQYGAGQGGGFDFWVVDTLPGWLFYGKTLSYGLGAFLLAVGLAGVFRRLIMAVKLKERMSILLLSFPLVYYLFMGSTSHYFARYAIVFVPFLALFAAEQIVALGRWLGEMQMRWGQVIWTLLVGLAVLWGTAKSIKHDLLLSKTDTRTQAKQWIEENLSTSSKLATDWPVHGPPLSTPQEPVPHSNGVYSVLQVGGTGLSEHSLRWYQDEGFNYLITTSYISEISLVDDEKDVEREQFYRGLADELELVKEFLPCDDCGELPFIFDEIYGPAVSLWQRERPGPIIRVYQIDAETG